MEKSQYAVGAPHNVCLRLGMRCAVVNLGLIQMQTPNFETAYSLMT